MYKRLESELPPSRTSRALTLVFVTPKTVWVASYGLATRCDLERRHVVHIRPPLCESFLSLLPGTRVSALAACSAVGAPARKQVQRWGGRRWCYTGDREGFFCECKGRRSSSVQAGIPTQALAHQGVQLKDNSVALPGELRYGWDGRLLLHYR